MRTIIEWHRTADEKPVAHQGFEDCGIQLLAVWDGEVMVAKYYATTGKWHYVDWNDALEPDWWAEYPLPPEENKEPLIVPLRIVEV